MFQARSEWRHIRLIFDHAEGPLIRFAYSLSWVLCSNYHNCCAKHACLYGCRLDVSVCGERGIPAPNPINAGWMAGPAEGEGGYRGRGRGGRAGGRDAGPTHSQWHSPGQHARLQPPGAPRDRLCTCCNPPPHTHHPQPGHQLLLIGGKSNLQQEYDSFVLHVSVGLCPFNRFSEQVPSSLTPSCLSYFQTWRSYF